MGPHQPDRADNEVYPFTEAELQRLIAYRSATAVGFYTDVCDSVDDVDDRALNLERLIRGGVEGHSFSHTELQRMAHYKLAIAIGIYTDALREGDTTNPAQG